MTTLPKRFSKEAEDWLVGALRDVTHLVHNGDDPTEAIVKIARREEFPATYLPLLVQGYNVGRTAFQREKTAGEGILARLAAFPLARIEDVREALYPEKVAAPAMEFHKTAVAECYSTAPRTLEPAVRLDYSREKVAALFERSAPVVDEQRIDKTSDWKKSAAAVDEARRLYHDARDNMLSCLTKLAGYFRSWPSGRRSLGEVRYNAQCLFGKAADMALDYCLHTVPHLNKEASFVPPGSAVHIEREPYCLVKAALDSGQAALAASWELRAAQATQQSKEASLPFTVGPFRKQADVYDDLGMSLPPDPTGTRPTSGVPATGSTVAVPTADAIKNQDENTQNLEGTQATAPAADDQPGPAQTARYQRMADRNEAMRSGQPHTHSNGQVETPLLPGQPRRQNSAVRAAQKGIRQQAAIAAPGRAWPGDPASAQPSPPPDTEAAIQQQKDLEAQKTPAGRDALTQQAQGQFEERHRAERALMGEPNLGLGPLDSSQGSPDLSYHGAVASPKPEEGQAPSAGTQSAGIPEWQINPATNKPYSPQGLAVVADRRKQFMAQHPGQEPTPADLVPTNARIGAGTNSAYEQAAGAPARATPPRFGSAASIALAQANPNQAMAPGLSSTPNQPSQMQARSGPFAGGPVNNPQTGQPVGAVPGEPNQATAQLKMMDQQNADRQHDFGVGQQAYAKDMGDSMDRFANIASGKTQQPVAQTAGPTLAGSTPPGSQPTPSPVRPGVASTMPTMGQMSQPPSTSASGLRQPAGGTMPGLREPPANTPGAMPVGAPTKPPGSLTAMSPPGGHSLLGGAGGMHPGGLGLGGKLASAMEQLTKIKNTYTKGDPDAPPITPTSELVQKRVLALNSPHHQQELQKIKVHGLLHDLSHNDEVLRGYHPHEITQAYNELAQLSPTASQQPAILRAALRKRLAAGVMEPFEAEQLAKIDQLLRPKPVGQKNESAVA